MNKKSGSVLMTGGLLLLAAALFLTCYNMWEEHCAETFSTAALGQILAEIPAEEPPTVLAENLQEADIPDYLLNPDMEMPAVEIEGEDYIGVLSIPVLELELPVISEWSYPRLKIAACRFEGSAYLDDLIVAAHNYRSHFGGLKNLRPGDAVTFVDADGNSFSYEVAETEVLGRDDLAGLERGDWDLTLFTCTVGGRARVVVRCGKIEQD